MLSRVWVKDFRNISDQILAFESFKHLYIYGDNNQGKTNFLESLYFIGNGKTPDKNSIETLLHFNSDSAYLGSDVIKDNEVNRIYMKLSQEDGRFMSLNDEVLKRTQRIESLCPVLYISSDFNRLFVSTPDARRRSFDMILSRLDSEYKQVLKAYKQVLNKNAALKSDASDALLDMYDERLSSFSDSIVRKRQSYAKFASKGVHPLLVATLSDDIETFSIDYQSRITQSLDTYSTCFMEVLKQNRFKEKQAKSSLYGPQR